MSIVSGIVLNDPVMMYLNTLCTGMKSIYKYDMSDTIPYKSLRLLNSGLAKTSKYSYWRYAVFSSSYIHSYTLHCR